MTKKILLIDDEEQIRKVLKRLFMKTDYEVFLAEGSQQALELLQEEKFDADHRPADARDGRI
jgi:DNA-binding NtrC family response regulator